MKLEQPRWCPEIAVHTPVIVQADIQKRKVLTIESRVSSAVSVISCSGGSCPDTGRGPDIDSIDGPLYGLGRAKGIVTVALHPPSVLQILRYRCGIDSVQDIPGSLVLSGEP